MQKYPKHNLWPTHNILEFKHIKSKYVKTIDLQATFKGQINNFLN